MPAKQVSCPVEVTLEAVAGRWKVMIIHQLLDDGPKRFNQLQRELKNITHRTLTKQLREMEERGLINRKDYGQIPPRVEYSLSPLGKTLKPVLMAMHEWGKKNDRKSKA
ncbi:MAG: helix-turn-helix domain-containing protein [Micavibrio sp.]